MERSSELTYHRLFPKLPLQFLRSTNMNARRMASSGMLRRVTPVRTDVSDELSASFIRVTRIGELVTTLAVLTIATRRNIREDAILQSH
jgi:hypothetical protein